MTGEIRRFLEGKASSGIDLERISLKPLQPRDALDLAQELTEDVRRVSWVVESGGGNPLFLEECARYQAAPTGGQLPSKMEDIIVQTAARLSSGSNEMVSLLSLFPKPIPIHLVKRITGATVSSANDEIQRLLQSGVVVSTGNGLAFRHDGIREAIYGKLPISKRKELHRSVCNLLLDASGDDEAVAYHQARAGLLSDAVATYERAARFNWEHHNYRTAEECFASATKFRKRIGEVPCELNLEYARCLKLAGKREQAKRILEGVLQGSSTSNEVRVLAYWNLADICRENPAASVRLYRLALSYAGESSPASVELLLSMAQVVGLAGRVTEADSLLAVAKKRLKVLGNAEDPSWLASITGNVLMSLCEHNRALKTLRAVHRPDTLDTNLLNNIAVCLEHLGKLDEACAYQLKALEVSRRLGRLSAELQSLANLGAFESKRGNFPQASSWFREAEDLCSSINFYRQGDRTNLPLLAADKASLHMNLGEYSRARKLLSAASRMNGKDRGSLQAIWIAFRKYELYKLTGESKLAERAMESVQTAELLETAFLRVERVILETSTGKFSKRDRLNLLQTALATAESIGTIHQRCRVLVELASNFIEAAETGEAKARLSEAEKLARKYGYRPLEARILLLRGIIAARATNKDFHLRRSHQLATELGLREIAAESAFRLGEHQFGLANLLNAREHLARSVASVEELSNEIPIRFRKRYLDLGWRIEARKMSAALDLQLPPRVDTSEKGLDQGHKVDRFFKSIYQTTILLGAATSIDDFVRTVNEAVRGTLKCDSVLMLCAREKAEFHPLAACRTFGVSPLFSTTVLFSPKL